MKEYISGYYCRDDLHLQVINKESNRRILQALKDAYPNGLTVFELAEVTDLPLKTIYAQKAELYREYYINHIDEKKIKTRGRPTIHTKEVESQRNRTRIVIEEANGVHDIYNGKKPIPLPPGNVVYSEGFVDAWHKIVTKEEEDELCLSLLQFLQKMVNRITEYDDEETKMCHLLCTCITTSFISITFQRLVQRYYLLFCYHSTFFLNLC